MKNFLAFLILVIISVYSSFAQSNNLSRYVDPFIGSAKHGHVFVGANLPFGAIQAGPTNNSTGWDWCSGYNYIDSTIIGFAQTHLSGTGIGDLGDIVLMPVTGQVIPKPGKPGNEASGYYSLFSHDEETAEAGYYAVKLKRYNILAEMTTALRTAFHQYTFPQTATAAIILDLEQGIGWDRPIATQAKQVNGTTLQGYRFSRGWAHDQRVYFHLQFSKPIVSIQYFAGDSLMAAWPSQPIRNLKAYIQFGPTNTNEIVQAKIALSPVSESNAKLNSETEIGDWNFERVRKNATAAWNKELSKIKIHSYDDEVLKKFYTALYHTMIAPSIFNDVNGDYWGTDKKLHKSATFTNYTTFSLWDTYRAAHPLINLIHTEKVPDIINTMLAIYKEQGKLPVWHLMGNETNTMVGSPGVIVVGDAIMKDFKGFDVNLAYEAMKNSQLNAKDTNIAEITRVGYLRSDRYNESVATAMEHAIADYAVAMVAKKLGKTADYNYWIKRGLGYKLYFDPITRFMRGKMDEENWREPFDPFHSAHRMNDYTEGTAWQYLWLVPQDVEGLMKLLGGPIPFTKKLDSFFVASGDMGEEASPDISGLIGQYAHGNEPSHHITYMYAYAGQPWKTAEKVRFILDSMYTTKPDGLIGNEDVGQMSAWYVLSALGIYQVNPVTGIFVFGSPVVSSATINVGAGKELFIKTENNSAANKYIQSITWNGKPYSKSYIDYKNLKNGGTLTFKMGNKPSKTFSTRMEDLPKSNK